MRWFLLLVLAFSLSACDDDDSGSWACADDPWVEQSLPAELVNGGIWGLDVGSDRAVGLAVTGDGSFVIEEGPEGWVVVGEGALPGTAPVAPASESSRFATGITVDAGGKIQAVGALVAEMKPVVWSETDGSWSLEEIDGTGFLQDVVPLGSSDVLAAGTGSTGIPFVTGSAGTAFVFDLEPFGSEAGLTALVEESGAIYGCGFNDGGDGTGQDPWRIVMKYDLGEWSSVPSPCGACGSYDLRAIEATPGALYVAGSARLIRTGDEPYGNGTSIESAWLAQWSFEESGWAQLLLPDAELLQRVNAILVASDGVTYLACGTPETAAYLVRVEPGAAPVIEQEFAGIQLFSLAETPDGRILAAGLEPGEVEGRPILLER